VINDEEIGDTRSSHGIGSSKMNPDFSCDLTTICRSGASP
jgi:hypothetical protein